MVLGYSELKKLSDNITCLNSDNIRGSSIDLSLSEEAKILIKKDIDFFEADEKSPFENLYETINLAKGYALKPQSLLYASTCEKVKIPIDKCGLIFPRSTFARLGLMLPLSFYANPGYEGHLPIVIFNASPCTITLPPYIRIAQLLFLEVKGKAKPYSDFLDTKYQNETNLTTTSFNDKEIGEILAKLR